MKNQVFLNKITRGDALEIMPKIEDNSIDLVLTDPPYFLDKLDSSWDSEKVGKTDNQYAVTSLPAGMKFGRQQGKDFYKWYSKVSEEIFRILKPGGFFFSFSSPRLYHRMASAIDDAGFELRDVLIWLYTQNQMKAMGLNHFIEKMDVGNEKKLEIKEKLSGWKTPQIKSCFEPIAMGQKPTNGTYLQNMLENKVGLLNTNIRIGDNMHPANVISTENMNETIDKVFLISKPDKKEKGEFNNHKTVKPLTICEYLIKLAAFSDDAVILDPFVGSGTTAVAAKRLGKNYIGMELNDIYAKIAETRLMGDDKLASVISLENKRKQMNFQLN